MVRHGWAVVCLAAAVGAGFGIEARGEDDRASSEAAQEMLLKLNEQQTLLLPGVTRLAVGDPEVADIKHLGDGKVQVVGTGEGATTLLVWTKDGGRTEYTIFVKR